MTEHNIIDYLKQQLGKSEQEVLGALEAEHLVIKEDGIIYFSDPGDAGTLSEISGIENVVEGLKDYFAHRRSDALPSLSSTNLSSTNLSTDLLTSPSDKKESLPNLSETNPLENPLANPPENSLEIICYYAQFSDNSFTKALETNGIGYNSKNKELYLLREVAQEVSAEDILPVVNYLNGIPCLDDSLETLSLDQLKTKWDKVVGIYQKYLKEKQLDAALNNLDDAEPASDASDISDEDLIALAVAPVTTSATNQPKVNGDTIDTMSRKASSKKAMDNLGKYYSNLRASLSRKALLYLGVGASVVLNLYLGYCLYNWYDNRINNLPVATSIVADNIGRDNLKEQKASLETKLSGLEDKLAQQYKKEGELIVKVALAKVQLNNQNRTAEAAEGYLTANNLLTEAELQEKNKEINTLQKKYVLLEGRLGFIQEFSRFSEKVSMAELKLIYGYNLHLLKGAVQARQDLTQAERSRQNSSEGYNELIDQLNGAMQKADDALVDCRVSQENMSYALAQGEEQLAKTEIKAETQIITDAERRYQTIKEGNSEEIQNSVVEYLDSLDGMQNGKGEISFPITFGADADVICVEALENLYTAMTGESGKEDFGAKANFIREAANLCGKVNPHDSKYRFILSE